MQQRIKEFNVEKWATGFMGDLEKTAEKQQHRQPNVLLQKELNPLLKKFSNSKRRLILLDYDGTLTGFRNQPEDAVPDDALLQLLLQLGNVEENEVYIISGRDHDTIGKWFGHCR